MRERSWDGFALLKRKQQKLRKVHKDVIRKKGATSVNGAEILTTAGNAEVNLRDNDNLIGFATTDRVRLADEELKVIVSSLHAPQIGLDTGREGNSAGANAPSDGGGCNRTRRKIESREVRHVADDVNSRSGKRSATRHDAKTNHRDRVIKRKSLTNRDPNGGDIDVREHLQMRLDDRVVTERILLASVRQFKEGANGGALYTQRSSGDGIEGRVDDGCVDGFGHILGGARESQRRSESGKRNERMEN